MMDFFRRKTIWLKSAFLGLMISSSLESMAQVPSTYQVGRWHQFKSAAVTYTFDDNCSNQIPVAIPLFNNYSFKTTFFTVTQSMNPNWTSIKGVANNGHEIASHTVTHADLSTSNIT
jgi:oligosaccharide reducing-end xylanase